VEDRRRQGETEVKKMKKRVKTKIRKKDVKTYFSKRRKREEKSLFPK
jgi:hypothetical protein